MKKSKNYIYTLILSLLVCSCGKNPDESNSEVDLSILNGPTIIYDLVGDNFFENRINNSNSDRVFLSDDYSRFNVRISPDKQRIAYVKNLVFYPFGIQNNGVPSVNISNNMGKTENVLMTYDSLSVYFIDWISNNRLAVSSREGSLHYITIINIEGEVLFREQVESFYLIYMLPDEQHLVTYNYVQFGILDVLTYDFQEFNPCEEIDDFHLEETDSFIFLPFYAGSSFIFNLDSDEYLECNLNDYSYKIYPLLNANERLLYANSTYHIYYNYSDEQLKLYEENELISTADINRYVCEIGLYLTEGNELYLIGESKEIDDEGVIIKVNFDSNHLTKLTNHGEDKFISNFMYYDY